MFEPWWVCYSLKLVLTHPTTTIRSGGFQPPQLDRGRRRPQPTMLGTGSEAAGQGTVGQVASFSASNADPPSAASEIERHIKKDVRTMVGLLLAEPRLDPPYNCGIGFQPVSCGHCD